MPHRKDPQQVRRRREQGFYNHTIESLLSGSTARSGQAGEVWAPPTDVYETREHVVIKMSLPGIKTGNVRVIVEDDVVTIRGYRESRPEAGVTAYHRMEIRNGPFEREVVIHKPINPEQSVARYQDGFLWLRIPKVAAPVRRVCTLRFRF